MLINRITNSIIEVLFPRYCHMCGTALSLNEKIICTYCLANLPYARISAIDNNFLEERLRLKIKVEHAASLIIYDKRDSNHKLLHLLKYRNFPEIGTLLGEISAAEIIDSRKYTGIDMIVPVPLHRKRLKKRGYNQSEAIAFGISRCMKIPVENNLIMRHVDNKSQTHKDNIARWTDTENIFRANTIESINGKHILLVDDIITSGATITNCAREIMKKYDVRISIFSLATVL